MSKRPTVLMILDGYGLNNNQKGNAVAEAKTPVVDKLMAEYPFVKGYASGLAVGLPDGQMGNSEVGHLNMGAGRIVYQELTRITKSIQDGDFFENKALLAACENVKKNDSALHLDGTCIRWRSTQPYRAYLSDFLSWQKDRDLRKFMYTASWMDVIHHRHQEKSM